MKSKPHSSSWPGEPTVWPDDQPDWQAGNSRTRRDSNWTSACWSIWMLVCLIFSLCFLYVLKGFSLLQANLNKKVSIAQIPPNRQCPKTREYLTSNSASFCSIHQVPLLHCRCAPDTEVGKCWVPESFPDLPSSLPCDDCTLWARRFFSLQFSC